MNTGALSAQKIKDFCKDISQNDPRVAHALDEIMSHKKPLTHMLSHNESSYRTTEIILSAFFIAERCAMIHWKSSCDNTLKAFESLFIRCGLKWHNAIAQRAYSFKIKDGHHRHMGHAYIAANEAARDQGHEICEINDGDDSYIFTLTKSNILPVWNFIDFDNKQQTWFGSPEWQFHSTFDELSMPKRFPGHPLDQLKHL